MWRFAQNGASHSFSGSWGFNLAGCFINLNVLLWSKNIAVCRPSPFHFNHFLFHLQLWHLHSDYFLLMFASHPFFSVFRWLSAADFLCSSISVRKRCLSWHRIVLILLVKGLKWQRSDSVWGLMDRFPAESHRLLSQTRGEPGGAVRPRTPLQWICLYCLWGHLNLILLPQQKVFYSFLSTSGNALSCYSQKMKRPVWLPWAHSRKSYMSTVLSLLLLPHCISEDLFKL